VNVRDFDFELPDDLIAQAPPPQRGASRLMAIDRVPGVIAHRQFAELPTMLQSGDVLVVNDTQVFPARLIGRRLHGGGAAECFLIRETEDADVWIALVHPGQRLREGALMVFPSTHAAPGGSRNVRSGQVNDTLYAEVLGSHFHGRRTVRLWTGGGTSVREAIEAIGHLPLPPYIKRDDVEDDRERYQTVYARSRGSIAAPTAGLHFTPQVLEALQARGIERLSITLHIGYGTFQPIRSERVEEHQMEAERYEVSDATAVALTQALQQGRRIIAVGTTTTRTLESLTIGSDGAVLPGAGATSLFIHPGYEFRIVRGLITNFHLPKSSLLMLVSAFGGRELMLRAYREAVANKYRFYSYGDAMFIA
jgi:S-adenosylmethionine:tRNA ribosyltransferase-isomerase